MLQTVLGGIREGYTMHVAADACAEATTYIHDVAIQRMVQAGAVPLTTFSLAAELQVDQGLPSGTIFAELTGKYQPETAVTAVPVAGGTLVAVSESLSPEIRFRTDTHVYRMPEPGGDHG